MLNNSIRKMPMHHDGKSGATGAQTHTQAVATQAPAAPVNFYPRAKILQLARDADMVTHDRPAMEGLRRELIDLHTHGIAPAEQGAHRLQCRVVDSYLSGPMRNPKVVAATSAARAIYAEVAAEATEIFLFGCGVGLGVLDINSDDQRCPVNLGADKCLLGIDGGMGVQFPLPLRRFVNVVRTSATDKLVTLQAQGPKTPAQVQKLIMAATRHAQREGCARVLFVNISTDKVPSFGAAVEATRSSVPVSYRELDWIDGEVPQTSAGRAAIVNFVDGLSKEILAAKGKTLVVFNCHIGLDRSGITNALTQLMVDHDPAADSLAVGEQVLRQIKRARPHAVSTVFRFELILDCLEELRAMRRNG